MNLKSPTILGFAVILIFGTKGSFSHSNFTKLRYEWHSNVSAGALLPSQHISDYKIHAFVNVLIADGETYFQIEPHFEAAALNLPFAATYKQGRVHFRADASDETWSVNVKRSLVTTFQLIENPQKGAFIAQEVNMYGSCQVEYFVETSENKTTVKKAIDENTCLESPTRFRSNTPPFACSSDLLEGVMSHNEKTYILLENQKPYINEISAFGTIHFQPFQALAEAHAIKVWQSLRLLSIEENMDVNVTNEKSLVQINITHTSDLDHDPTEGRIPSNKTVLKAEIYTLLDKLTDSLNWKLSTYKLDNQTSFHILELMWWLDANDWEELYDTLILGTSYTQETNQHFFWDLVPQVGSESAAFFIKKLVISKRVKGLKAALLLTTFPLHMKEITEKFVSNSEDLANLMDVDSDVKYAAILSFTALVGKVCVDRCTELVDRYTKLFLDRFTSNENYQTRLLYLRALANMKLSRILDYLSPIISNTCYDRHVRYLAVWCASSGVERNPRKVGEVFWPIFRNKSESLEMRTAACSMLMKALPTDSRLLTFFWHMISEPNYHLYNFFYTTIRSYADTKYPCYQSMRRVASQLSRYMQPRGYRWGTGNYILDYEDPVRGIGGLLHVSIVASDTTGLPNTLYLATEHHSHGLSSKYAVSVKLQGVAKALRKTFKDEIVNLFKREDVMQLMNRLNYTTKWPEPVHVEMSVMVDGSWLYCKYLNESTLSEIIDTVKRASALYYVFSVNHQRLRFPLRYEMIRLTDLGTAVTLQLRTASLLSLRGSVNQTESGKIRDAELDFRYSMDTVTSLKTFNPLSKEWYGTDRMRSLHTRIPFSNNLMEMIRSSVFQMTANRHKDFMDGSRLGIVWHSTIKLFPQRANLIRLDEDNSDSAYCWEMESRDIGAKLEAKIFECRGENDISDSLVIIKEAFQITNKNYRMVVGGAPILGLYSLANYFTFLPPGDSCGIIVSLSPLQVRTVILKEGDMLRLSMETEPKDSKSAERQKNDIIWELTSYYREKENSGYTEINFWLDRGADQGTNVSTTLAAPRMLQLEGYLKLPSYKQGVLQVPNPVEGKARLVWGTETRTATSLELKIITDNSTKSWPSNCRNDTATCLQVTSNFDTRQKITLDAGNLPMWITAALVSIFPNNIRADKDLTQAHFSIPSKVPWTHKGLCVVNSKSVLDFDNGTVRGFSQRMDCYSNVVADCSNANEFLIAVKKASNSNDFLDVKIVYAYSNVSLEIRPQESKNASFESLLVNGAVFPLTGNYQNYPEQSSTSNYMFRCKYWEASHMTEVIIGHSGMTIQHYKHTLVAVASENLRGSLCGLCGDFNGETSNDIKLPGMCFQL